MNEREAGIVAKMVDRQLAAAEKRIVAKAEGAVAAALENVPEAQHIIRMAETITQQAEMLGILFERIKSLESELAAMPGRFSEGVGKHIEAIRRARLEARGPQQ